MSAVYAAIDLARQPGLARLMRENPLPPDVLSLVQVAAGDPKMIAHWTGQTAEPPAFLRAAAKFYVRQVLWAGGQNHYRTLGANPDTPPERVTELFRAFMKWLHPDVTRDEGMAGGAIRVLRAWNVLKNPEMRQRYDRTLADQRAQQSALRRSDRISRRRVPWVLRPSDLHLDAG